MRDLYERERERETKPKWALRRLGFEPEMWNLVSSVGRAYCLALPQIQKS